MGAASHCVAHPALELLGQFVHRDHTPVSHLISSDHNDTGAADDLVCRAVGRAYGWSTIRPTLSAGAVGASAFGGAQPERLGARFDDGRVEGQAVDDRCGYLDFDFRILPLTWYFVSWTGVFD
ncbi:hypothetical protein [Amycolatopsis keratiniphila]|uniref:hypothetical protein n=1 Tax=Amycolatopsis keratiniphila TaxID=129921 RepID=UPI001560154F|nr:hypothetical protein [Amycolatopsis keratiniphila]